MAFCRFCGSRLEDENKGCSCPEALAEAAANQEKEAVQKNEPAVSEAAEPQSVWKEVPQSGQSMPQQENSAPAAPIYQQVPQALEQPQQGAAPAAPQGVPQMTVPQGTAAQDTVAQTYFSGAAPASPQGVPQQGATPVSPHGMPQQGTPPVYHSQGTGSQFMKEAKDAVKNRNFLQEIKDLLVSPSAGVAKMLGSKDYMLPGVLILAHAVIAALFSLLIGLKMDDILEGIYVNPVLSLFITVVISVIISALYAASIFVASKLFRLECSMNQAFSIAGLRSLMVIPFAFLGFLFVSLSLGLGMFLFYLPLYLSPLVYANSLRAIDADKDKSMRVSVVATIIFIIVFMIIARMMFKVYFPGVGDMMRLFGGGIYGY
ncbi:MAG: hypothetical protein Q4A19_03455 [Johnsonella sp.]|nr:hypothetical protein [Johnsonella sp.]